MDIMSVHLFKYLFSVLWGIYRVDVFETSDGRDEGKYLAFVIVMVEGSRNSWFLTGAYFLYKNIERKSV